MDAATLRDIEGKLTRLRSIISGTLDEAARVKARNFDPQRNLFTASRGSVAFREIAEESNFKATEGSRPIQDAHSAALVKLVSAHQHLQALLVLVDEPLAYPPATIARGVLESSANAWWLLDTGISTRRRVMRGWGDRWAMLEEIRKIPVDRFRRHALNRMAQLASHAEAIGVKVERNAEGEPIRPKEFELAPAATDVIRQQLSEIGKTVGEVAFRWLSSTAHSLLHGLMEDTRPVGLTPEDPALNLVAPEASPDALATRAATAVFSYQFAVSRLVKFYGWGGIEWGAWATESQRALRALLRERQPGVAAKEDPRTP